MKLIKTTIALFIMLILSGSAFAQETEKIVPWYDNPDNYVIQDSQIKKINNIYKQNYSTINIYRKDGYTLVDIIAYIKNMPTWLSISKNTYITDRKTGDKYMLHKAMNGVPMDKLLVIKDKKNKGSHIVLSLIFPPLKKGVRKVDFTEIVTDDIIYPNNRKYKYSRWNRRSIKVKSSRHISPSQYAKQTNKVYRLDEGFEIKDDSNN